MSSSAGFCAATIALAWVLRLMLVRDNRKIRQTGNETKVLYVY
jgi:hypothetical protein